MTDTPLWDVKPHVLRHGFASIANDLGFTESTIAALIGNAKGSVTNRYVHTLDSTLNMAADTVAGYLKALLEGVEFRRNTYMLDRKSRRSAIEHMLIEWRSAPEPRLLEFRSEDPRCRARGWEHVDEALDGQTNDRIDRDRRVSAVMLRESQAQSVDLNTCSWSWCARAEI